MEAMKFVCIECDWHGNELTVQRAPNPIYAQEEVFGCPRCNAFETMQRACDVAGCWKLGSGTTTPGRYKILCLQHFDSHGQSTQ
jgi:hypothetical protein